MRTMLHRRLPLVAIALATLIAPRAHAQAFGLDLSEEVPGPPSSEHRPRLAVVLAPGTDTLASGAIEVALRALPDFELFLTGEASERALASARDVPARDCQTDACLTRLLVALDADVVLSVRPAGLGLVLAARDFGPSGVQELALSDEQLVNELVDQLDGYLAPLSPERGILVVRVPDQAARVHLANQLLGQGNQTRRVAPDLQDLRVDLEGRVPFAGRVLPASGRTFEVDVVLPDPNAQAYVDPDATLETSGPRPPPAPLLQQPGFYVAMVGVVAAAVGAGFGLSAKSIESRAVDANGDGALDLTRREAESARAQANLANVLFGAGGAVAAGGAAWWLLAPVSSGMAGSQALAPRLDGLQLTFGGSF